jgi:hypothetical protein
MRAQTPSPKRAGGFVVKGSDPQIAGVLGGADYYRFGMILEVHFPGPLGLCLGMPDYDAVYRTEGSQGCHIISVVFHIFPAGQHPSWLHHVQKLEFLGFLWNFHWLDWDWSFDQG